VEGYLDRGTYTVDIRQGNVVLVLGED